MELRQLEYVLAVAKYKSFTRAAADIKISQSSLSQQIGKLENELGTALFVRSTRSVEVTAVGAEFIKRAQNIVSKVTEARQSILDYVSLKKGRLSLGTIPILGHYDLPSLVASFQKNFPDISLNILEEMDEELLQMLHFSKIDAAFVQRTNPDLDLRYYPLLLDKMVAVVSPRHPLAYRKSVDLRELAGDSFIVPRVTSGHYQDFHRACTAAGFDPRIVLHCSVVKTMLGFVREDVGITLLSSHVAAAEQDQGVRIIKLTPTIERKVILAVRNTAELPPALRGFIKLASQWVNAKTAKEDSKVTAIGSRLVKTPGHLVFRAAGEADSSSRRA